MNRHPLVGVLGAAAALMLLASSVSTHQASASQLSVTSGPIQTWTIDADLPLLAAAAEVSPIVETAAPDAAAGPDGVEQPREPAEPGQEGEPGEPGLPGEPGEDGKPEAPGTTPEVDLTDCGDLSAYTEIVYGTERADELVADEGRQILVGLGGDDVLLSGSGDDCLVGGDGEDRLVGGDGADVLDAGLDDGDSCVEETYDEVVACGPVDLDVPAEEAVANGQGAGTPRDVPGGAGSAESSAPEPETKEAEAPAPAEQEQAAAEQVEVAQDGAGSVEALPSE